MAGKKRNEVINYLKDKKIYSEEIKNLLGNFKQITKISYNINGEIEIYSKNECPYIKIYENGDYYYSEIKIQ